MKKLAKIAGVLLLIAAFGVVVLKAVDYTDSVRAQHQQMAQIVIAPYDTIQEQHVREAIGQYEMEKDDKFKQALLAQIKDRASTLPKPALDIQQFLDKHK